LGPLAVNLLIHAHGSEFDDGISLPPITEERLAAAFVSSEAFSDTNNSGRPVDPNAPENAIVVQNLFLHTLGHLPTHHTLKLGGVYSLRLIGGRLRRDDQHNNQRPPPRRSNANGHCRTSGGCAPTDNIGEECSRTADTKHDENLVSKRATKQRKKQPKYRSTVAVVAATVSLISLA
jgi:hypothetical protein